MKAAYNASTAPLLRKGFPLPRASKINILA
jgi:hypothetical protein